MPSAYLTELYDRTLEPAIAVGFSSLLVADFLLGEASHSRSILLDKLLRALHGVKPQSDGDRYSPLCAGIHDFDALHESVTLRFCGCRRWSQRLSSTRTIPNGLMTAEQELLGS